MKHLLAVVLTLGCAAAAHAQPKNDAERAGLLGRVKSVELGRIEYPLKDGRGVEGKKSPIQLTTFNEDGNKTEVTSYKLDGAVSEKTIYLYDAQGRSVGTETDYWTGQSGAAGAYKQKIVYTLDERGNRIEEVGYQTDGTISHRHLFKYDAIGRQTEAIYYSWNGTRVGKIAYAYDERGNQIAVTSYREDDSEGYRAASTYDARGNRVEWVKYEGATLRNRVLYRYDEKGRVKEIVTTEHNAQPNLRPSHAPVPGRIVYTYDDDNGTKEEATYGEEGALLSRVVKSVDGKGDETGRAEFWPDGSRKYAQLRWYDKGKLLREVDGESSTKVEYDAEGNWTRKTFLIRPKDSDKPEAHGAEYRLITYY